MGFNFFFIHLILIQCFLKMEFAGHSLETSDARSLKKDFLKWGTLGQSSNRLHLKEQNYYGNGNDGLCQANSKFSLRKIRSSAKFLASVGHTSSPLTQEKQYFDTKKYHIDKPNDIQTLKAQANFKKLFLTSKSYIIFKKYLKRDNDFPILLSGLKSGNIFLRLTTINNNSLQSDQLLNSMRNKKVKRQEMDSIQKGKLTNLLGKGTALSNFSRENEAVKKKICKRNKGSPRESPSIVTDDSLNEDTCFKQQCQFESQDECNIFKQHYLLITFLAFLFAILFVFALLSLYVLLKYYHCTPCSKLRSQPSKEKTAEELFKDTPLDVDKNMELTETLTCKRPEKEKCKCFDAIVNCSKKENMTVPSLLIQESARKKSCVCLCPRSSRDKESVSTDKRLLSLAPTDSRASSLSFKTQVREGANDVLCLNPPKATKTPHDETKIIQQSIRKTALRNECAIHLKRPPAPVGQTLFYAATEEDDDDEEGYTYTTSYISSIEAFNPLEVRHDYHLNYPEAFAKYIYEK